MTKILRIAFAFWITVNPLNAKEMFKFGQDINYPPYAYKNTTTGKLAGFGYDIAMGMNDLCNDIEIEVVQVKWADCWGEGKIGPKLDSGDVDACMTYTHTKGIRQEYCEFSNGILNVNKAAGLITSLDAYGVPKVKGNENLNGRTVVDVDGWAPTADGLDFVTNFCTGQLYGGDFKVHGANNDEALRMTLNGSADAMFVYADQAYNFKCKEGQDSSEWDCALWGGFGKTFAYVQTGQFGYVENGTTIAMAKLGSGVVNKINPCLQRFMASKAYYDICASYDKVDECYPNAFFPPPEFIPKAEYNKKTNEHPGPCSTGYCACPAPARTISPLVLGLLIGGGACCLICAAVAGVAMLMQKKRGYDPEEDEDLEELE